MKEKKNHVVTVRINDSQLLQLEKLIEEGKVKTNAEAIQYLINMAMITGSKA